MRFKISDLKLKAQGAATAFPKAADVDSAGDVKGVFSFENELSIRSNVPSLVLSLEY